MRTEVERRVRALETEAQGSGVRVIFMGPHSPEFPHILSTAFDGTTLVQSQGESVEVFRQRASLLALRGRLPGSNVVWAEPTDLDL